MMCMYLVQNIQGTLKICVTIKHGFISMSVHLLRETTQHNWLKGGCTRCVYIKHVILSSRYIRIYERNVIFIGNYNDTTHRLIHTAIISHVLRFQVDNTHKYYLLNG